MYIEIIGLEGLRASLAHVTHPHELSYNVSSIAWQMVLDLSSRGMMQLDSNNGLSQNEKFIRT